MIITSDNIDTIARILGAKKELNGPETLLTIGGATSATGTVVLTITALADGGTVISAQTVHGYFELHAATRYVPVEPDEVIFIAEEGERISGLVVGATAACSLFANVHRSTLTADFTTLEPALLLAAMQLGLAENMDVVGNGE